MTHARHARTTDREAGFSLLELMVALAILALAATALVRLNALSTRTAGTVGERTMAQITADAVATRIATDPGAPPVGTMRTAMINGGVALNVETMTTPTADPAVVTVAIRVTTQRAQPAALVAGRADAGAARRLVVRRAAS